MGYTLEDKIYDGWLESIDATGSVSKKDYDMFLRHALDYITDCALSGNKGIPLGYWECDCGKLYFKHTRKQFSACALNGNLVTMPVDLIPLDDWLAKHDPAGNLSDQELILMRM